jgi:hypothetical protein
MLRYVRLRTLSEYAGPRFILLRSSCYLELDYDKQSRGHSTLLSSTQSMLSFESDSDSSSETSDFTVTSSSSVWGATAVVIQARLQSLKSLFPHNDGVEGKTIQKAYQAMLELTRSVKLSKCRILTIQNRPSAYRRGCYSPRVRKQALIGPIPQLLSRLEFF